MKCWWSKPLRPSVPQDLKPETEYRVDLYIIPVHGTAKELVSEKAVTFRTLPPVQG